MTDSLTIAGLLRPSTRKYAIAYDITIVLGASLLIAACAQVSLLLPFSPVPVTGQTFAVLVIAALLGSERATLAVIAYICQGLAGLPVFALIKASPAALFGPTGGYLLGFIAGAYLTGLLAERGWDRKIPTAIVAMAAGNLTIYAFGAAWLSVLTGPQTALATGIVPFIPGDLLKIALAAVALPAGWKLFEKISLKSQSQ